MKYRFAAKEKRLAFGVYPDISLKPAREAAGRACGLDFYAAAHAGMLSLKNY